jgi:predicted DNA-binding protein
MDDLRTTTIRQPAEQAETLETVARIDGVSVSEAIRQAIANHIEARRNDPDFRARLQERMREDRVILEKLAQ